MGKRSNPKQALEDYFQTVIRWIGTNDRKSALEGLQNLYDAAGLGKGTDREQLGLNSHLGQVRQALKDPQSGLSIDKLIAINLDGKEDVYRQPIRLYFTALQEFCEHFNDDE